MIMIDDSAVRDPEIYENLEKFDAYRYLRKRERAGEENGHQFVTTSPDNLACGHGQHACPGRFFASTEMKVLFCLILLRYDLRYVPGADPPKYTRFKHHVAAPPDLKVQFRRRKEEIDLLHPKDGQRQQSPSVHIPKDKYLAFKSTASVTAIMFTYSRDIQSCPRILTTGRR